MYLENVVIDAVEPQRLGRFWEAVLGGARLTDEPDAFEMRLTVPGGPVLDLCVQRVPQPPFESPRLHLDLAGRPRQAHEVERLLGEHHTSTSARAMRPGWCSRTWRAIGSASWRIEWPTPTPDPWQRSRWTLPTRRETRSSGPG